MIKNNLYSFYNKKKNRKINIFFSIQKQELLKNLNTKTGERKDIEGELQIEFSIASKVIPTNSQINTQQQFHLLPIWFYKMYWSQSSKKMKPYIYNIFTKEYTDYIK